MDKAQEHAVDIDAAAAVQFVVDVARLRRDGEGTYTRDDAVIGIGDPGDRWVMDNEDAYDKLHELIADARALLGWEPGSPPLDGDEYAEFCFACGKRETADHDCGT